MKPSFFNFFISNAKSSLSRFPLVILCSILVCCTSIYLIEYELKELFYINIIILLATGVPLFFSIKVFSEQFDNVIYSWIGKGIGLLILLLFFFTLPQEENTLNTHEPYIRFGLFNIFVHLIVSIAPFSNKNFQNGFWQYNRMLFTRFFLSLLYSGVLYIGICLALLAIHNLFTIEIPDKSYGYLFIFCASILNIWIFMGGMEKDIQKLEDSKEFPTGLKIFTQYILLGLVILYFLILYAYGTTIIISNEWPKGLISYLIIGVSIVGYLTVLLLYPYAKEYEKHWLGVFSKVFNFLVLPLVILLFIAVGMRIGEYGFTVNRYFIVLLGIWLTTISVVRIVKPLWIKIVPTSIAIFVLLSSFGFWGAMSVSQNSQMNRLMTILEKNNLLKDGKLIQEFDYQSSKLLAGKQKVSVDQEIQTEIVNILEYLDTYHGFEKLTPIFTQNLDSLILKEINDSESNRRYLNEASIFSSVLGISNNEFDEATIMTPNTYHYYVTEPKMTKVSHFDYFTSFIDNYDHKDEVFRIEDDKFLFHLDSETHNFTVTKNKKKLVSHSLTESLIKLKNTQKNNQDLPIKEMEFSMKKNGYIFKIRFHSLSFSEDKTTNKISLTHFNYAIFIKTPNSSEPSGHSTVE